MSELKHEQLIGAALPWLALLTAVALAGAAAYFSIIGLTLVFVGAIVPVAIMGSFVEAAKLVGVSWLYRNWKLASRKLRYGLSALVLGAMIVTSLGVFGFLSRAYTEHAADSQGIEIQVQQIEQQIAEQEKTQDQAQRTLDQLNESLNTLIEYDKISGEDGYRAVRERNLPTINEMQEIISRTNSRITELTQDKLSLERDVSVREAEIGPIRFVAEMIWGQEDAKDNYDRAVRFLIMLLVFIFDPFAIMLLLAANHSLMMRQEQKIQRKGNGGSGGGDDDPLPEGPKDLNDLRPVETPSQEPEPTKPEPTVESTPEPRDVPSAFKDSINATPLNEAEYEAIDSKMDALKERVKNLTPEATIEPTADPVKVFSEGTIEFVDSRSKYTYRNRHSA